MNVPLIFTNAITVALIKALRGSIPPTTLSISFKADLKNQLVCIYFAFQKRHTFTDELVAEVVTRLKDISGVPVSVETQVWIGSSQDPTWDKGRTYVYSALDESFI